MAIAMRPTETSNKQDTQALHTMRIVSHPVRWQMLGMLLADEGTVNVQDLADRCKRKQPTISHHLKALEECGVVVGGKHGWGKSIYYTVCREKLADVMFLVSALLAGKEATK